MLSTFLYIFICLFDIFIYLGTKKSRTSREFFKLWWPRTGLNRRHEDFQSSALPTELPGHLLLKKRLADHTGIEPVIFSVTGRHVNRYTNGPCSQRFYIIKEISINCKFKLSKNKGAISSPCLSN